MTSSGLTENFALFLLEGFFPNTLAAVLMELFNFSCERYSRDQTRGCAQMPFFVTTLKMGFLHLKFTLHCV